MPFVVEERRSGWKGQKAKHYLYQDPRTGKRIHLETIPFGWYLYAFQIEPPRRLIEWPLKKLRQAAKYARKVSSELLRPTDSLYSERLKYADPDEVMRDVLTAMVDDKLTFLYMLGDSVHSETEQPLWDFAFFHLERVLREKYKTKGVYFAKGEEVCPFYSCPFSTPLSNHIVPIDNIVFGEYYLQLLRDPLPLRFMVCSEDDERCLNHIRKIEGQIMTLLSRYYGSKSGERIKKLIHTGRMHRIVRALLEGESDWHRLLLGD